MIFGAKGGRFGENIGLAVGEAIGNLFGVFWFFIFCDLLWRMGLGRKVLEVEIFLVCLVRIGFRVFSKNDILLMIHLVVLIK